VSLYNQFTDDTQTACQYLQYKFITHELLKGSPPVELLTGTFVRWNFHCLVLSVPGTLAPWNFRSRERKWRGTKPKFVRKTDNQLTKYCFPFQNIGLQFKNISIFKLSATKRVCLLSGYILPMTASIFTCSHLDLNFPGGKSPDSCLQD